MAALRGPGFDAEVYADVGIVSFGPIPGDSSAVVGISAEVQLDPSGYLTGSPWIRDDT
ncbi:hypothetical protein [Nocardia brasiliensis]|uniref:hypothetical protein n=1 Tax=Nocardia brasiliensis TaxID=37326 RepID=UPI0024539B66|nr:hypothetical protein [Nocardia brasiliensis]